MRNITHDAARHDKSGLMGDSFSLEVRHDKVTYVVLRNTNSFNDSNANCSCFFLHQSDALEHITKHPEREREREINYGC